MRLSPSPWRRWQVVFWTILTSWVGGALVSAETLGAEGRPHARRRVLAAGLGGGMLLLAAAAVLPLQWQLLSLSFLAANVGAGLLLAWVVGAGSRTLEGHVRARPRPGLVLGLAFVWAFVGGATGLVYLAASDSLVGTVLPSVASRVGTFGTFTALVFDFALVGLFLGAHLDMRHDVENSNVVVRSLAGSTLGYYAADAVGTLLVRIPEFQARSLIDHTSVGESLMTAALAAAGLRGLVLCASYCGALAFTASTPLQWRPCLRAMALIMTTTVAGIASLIVYTGQTSTDILALGQLAEKRGKLATARTLYSAGLAQRPEGYVASYLQYQVGLLARQLGDREAATHALRRVVTEHPERETLVARAQAFLDALEHAPDEAQRYIIDGVDTQTEFKSAYCVPNSLALVLQFWDVPLSARRIGRDITALDLGTTAAAAHWYVQQHGLHQWFMPLASIDDIKRFVADDIPVLVYIPRHVLAVIGYDEALDSLVTYDVAQADIWVDQPVRELLPAWKGDLGVLGVVLPPARFAALPEAEQATLRRWTRAQLHHELHYGYHRSDEPADDDRALEHLEASIAAAPELFFDVAHVAARSAWKAQRDPTLVSTKTLTRAAAAGRAYTTHHFDDEGALADLALMHVELGAFEELHDFLKTRARAETLAEHDRLRAMLGLLEFRLGNPHAASAYLGALEGIDRHPMILARAFEDTGSWEAAATEYRRVVDDDDAWDGRRPLHRRRVALARTLALADAGQDVPLRGALASYVAQFPWDVDAQLRYAEALVEALRAEPTPPADTVATVQRDLTRALAFVRAMDLRQRWTRELEQLEHAADLPSRG